MVDFRQESVRLLQVAGAAALLVQEGVIAEANYQKCLETWIKKNANSHPGMLRVAAKTLTLEKVTADVLARNGIRPLAAVHTKGVAP